MKKNILVAGLVILFIIGIIAFSSSKDQGKVLKIGVITPLTGGSAYYGESTKVGIKLAEAELKKENINISFIVEDGQLDPKVALSAAQKLVNVDGIKAIYSEFNPASISVSSFLKGKNIFHLYDSAAVSPLNEGPNNFKTYLDYQASCKEVSQYIKDNKGVAKVGVLKINIEFGDLCVKGIQEVYGDQVVVESYDPGNTDFKVAISKLSRANVDVIFNPSFKAETVTSLKQMKDLGINKLFVGLTETVTPDVSESLGGFIQGDIFFGLPRVSSSLKEKIKNQNGGDDVGDYNAAGSAYVHMMQLGKAISVCNSDSTCVASELSKATSNAEIGFEGFFNRIAKFDNLISEWKGDGFVDVK